MIKSVTRGRMQQDQVAVPGGNEDRKPIQCQKIVRSRLPSPHSIGLTCLACIMVLYYSTVLYQYDATKCDIVTARLQSSTISLSTVSWHTCDSSHVSRPHRLIANRLRH